MKIITKIAFWLFKVNPNLINPKYWQRTGNCDYLYRVIGDNVPYFQNKIFVHYDLGTSYKNTMPPMVMEKDVLFLKNGVIFQTCNDNLKFKYVLHKEEIKENGQIEQQFIDEYFDEIQVGRGVPVKIGFKNKPNIKHGKFVTRLIVMELRKNIQKSKNDLLPAAQKEQVVLARLALLPTLLEIRSRAENSGAENTYAANSKLAFDAETKKLFIIGRKAGFTDQEINIAATEFLNKMSGIRTAS